MLLAEGTVNCPQDQDCNILRVRFLPTRASPGIKGYQPSRTPGIIINFQVTTESGCEIFTGPTKVSTLLEETFPGITTVVLSTIVATIMQQHHFLPFPASH